MIPTIKVESESHMKAIRAKGLREAAFYEVTDANKSRLIWLMYPNGERRINIWKKIHKEDK